MICVISRCLLKTTPATSDNSRQGAARPQGKRRGPCALGQAAGVPGLDKVLEESTGFVRLQVREEPVVRRAEPANKNIKDKRRTKRAVRDAQTARFIRECRQQVEKKALDD